jgi:hypothetical protein
MKNFLLLLSLFSAVQSFGQSPPPKFSLNGGARAVYFADRLQLAGDTVTLPRENSGHVLADLGVNIRPNAATEVQAMVRIRNDYGGFWGSGVSFDIRQLTVKGLIQNRFKYTVGDMDYALTPYTMFRAAPVLELFNGVQAMQTIQQNMPGYDVFMNNNGTWRTQGAALDFGLLFKKGPQKMSNSLFAMRLRPGFGGAATEQWAFGGRTELIWGDFPLRVGGTLVSVNDLGGTSASTDLYRNTVLATDGSLGNGFLRLNWELGNSRSQFADTGNTVKSDYFYTVGLKIGKQWQVRYAEVGPDYFNPAAQTTAYNPAGIPRSFRAVGNERALRTASLYDFAREAGLYRAAWSTTLGDDQSNYLLLDPFGEATPNRRGVTIGWQPGALVKGFSLSTRLQWFSEIRGSGTTSLTQFTRAEVTAGYALRKFDAKLMYRYQNAFRPSDNAEVPALNVQMPWLSANLGYQLNKDLRFDAGLIQVQNRGTGFNAERNAQNEIVFYNEVKYDYVETLPVLSVSYKVFGKSTLQAGMLLSNVREAGIQMNIRSGFLAYFIQF